MRTGDLVIVGRIDNRLGLYNGTRAIVTAIHVETDSLTLHTDDDRHVSIPAIWAADHNLSHAYAMTLHKAQGLTVDHGLLYGSDSLPRGRPRRTLQGRRENHIYLSPTMRMSGRTGECDFDQADSLADHAQPIAALARGLHTSRSHELASHQQPGGWARPGPYDEPSRTRMEGDSR
jgi:hypothetical protein